MAGFWRRIFGDASSDAFPVSIDSARTAVQVYNEGVGHFTANRLADAEREFASAHRASDATPALKMVAVYARATCLSQLGRPVEVPQGFNGDQAGSTYFGYTVAAMLVSDGHSVAVKAGDVQTVVDVLVGPGLFRFAVSSLGGRFIAMWSRMEESGAVRVSELVAGPHPRPENSYVSLLDQSLRRGPPVPTIMPRSWFPESLIGAEVDGSQSVRIDERRDTPAELDLTSEQRSFSPQGADLQARQALHSRLLSQVFGDRKAAERLIALERKHNPDGTDSEWIAAASRRIEEDNTGRWS